MLDPKLLVLSEAFIEQAWRAVKWIESDVSAKLRRDKRMMSIITGIARISTSQPRPLTSLLRLPAFPHETYREYFSRSLAAIEISSPTVLEEGAKLRSCIREFDLYEALLKAMDTAILEAASSLASSCNTSLWVVSLPLALLLAGILHGIRAVVEDTIKLRRPVNHRCPICGLGPSLAIRAASKGYRIICGWCGFTWNTDSPCYGCGENEKIEEVVAGAKIVKCGSCNHRVAVLDSEPSVISILEPKSLHYALLLGRVV